MSDNLLPAQLPTLSERLSTWLGFKVPTIALPQTAKNRDKAAARLLAAGAGNLASRIERDTLLREAKATAEARVIEAAGAHLIEKVKEDSALTERALEFSFSESILKQSNREKIVTLAVEDLNSKTAHEPVDASSEIDDDWLNSFGEFASHKSNAEIQTLWGKILSGKIRSPSSFSLQSLQLLSALDTDDANTIHRVLAYAIDGKFILKSKFASDLSDILVCEDLGVLSGSSSMLSLNFHIKAVPSVGLAYPLSKPSVIFKISKIILWCRFAEERMMQIPCFQLTRFGRELYSLSGEFERDEEYERQFIEFLKANGATVQRALIGGPFEDV